MFEWPRHESVAENQDNPHKNIKRYFTGHQAFWVEIQCMDFLFAWFSFCITFSWQDGEVSETTSGLWAIYYPHFYLIPMNYLKQDLDNLSPEHSMETKQNHTSQFTDLILRAMHAVWTRFLESVKHMSSFSGNWNHFLQPGWDPTSK